MRSVDLALYADELAARAATLAAQLERARCRLRREAIEREARRALGEGSVARLESLRLIRASDVSTRDYFHPSLEGQRVLAEVTWNAGPLAGL
jgi:uncharacterized protein involved in type VI secretion and phage assembly